MLLVHFPQVELVHLLQAELVHLPQLELLPPEKAQKRRHNQLNRRNHSCCFSYNVLSCNVLSCSTTFLFRSQLANSRSPQLPCRRMQCGNSTVV